VGQLLYVHILRRTGWQALRKGMEALRAAEYLVPGGHSGRLRRGFLKTKEAGN